MAFTLTYAGVPIMTEDVQGPLQHLQAYLKKKSEEYTQYLDGRHNFPRLSPFTFPKLTESAPLEIGDLFYPAGAAAWMEGTFLVTTAQLVAIEAITLPGGSTKAQPSTLVLQADISDPAGFFIPLDPQAIGGVSISNVYMLPPRPVSFQSAQLTDLWLLTLVDERYFFSQLSTAILQPDGTSVTWDNLFASVCTSLGINALTSGNPSAYGFPDPDSPLWSSYEHAGILLNALAYNTGFFVVRGYNGTYSLQTAPQCIIAGNSPTYQVAGGPMLSQAEANLILPAQVTCTFPMYQDGVGYIDPRNPTFVEKPSYGKVYAITTSLSGQFGGIYNGVNTTKDIHDTCKAFFPNSTGTGLPDNQTQLTNLATQLSLDYWNLKLNATTLNQVFPGVRNWTPTGLHDVVFSFRHRRPTTRVYPRPWNWEALEFCHANYGTGVIGGKGQVITKLETDVSLAGGTTNNNYDFGTASVLNISTTGTGVVNITGLKAPSPAASQLLVIWCKGGVPVVLQNQNGGSSVANQIKTPLGNDFTLYPLDGITLEYEVQGGYWRVDNPILGAGAGSVTDYPVRGLLFQTGLTYTPANSSGIAVVTASGGGGGGGTKPWEYWNNISQVGPGWYVAGQHDPLSVPPTAANGPGANLITAIPFVNLRASVVSAVAYYSLAAVANQHIRVGIYNNTGDINLYPNTLVIDLGQLTVGTNNTVGNWNAYTGLSTSLASNSLYWFVFLTDALIQTLNLTPYNILGSPIPASAIGAPGAGTFTQFGVWQKSQAFGALPGTFPAGATPVAGAPMLFISFSS